VRLKTTETGKSLKSKLVPEVSSVMGVEVYTYRDNWPDGYFEQRLLSKSLLILFKKIDFGPVIEFELSPLHLRVTSSFRFTSHCVEQVQIFQELMVLAFEQAKERQNHSF
jgi:hypothetical protein